MSRSSRALQNAVIAVAVFLAYVVACMLVMSGIAVDELSPGRLDGLPTLLITLLWGAGAVFVASFVFDGWVAKLPGPPIQRLVVLLVLVCGAIAFALWFDSLLAADDDRDVFGWLTIPAALLYGLIARLAPAHSESERALGRSAAK